MCRPRRMLSKCVDKSRNSKMRYQLCAIVAKGSNIISIGWNHWSHPDFSTHAEAHALTRASITEGCDLYIARGRVEGVGLAMPCKNCLEKIKEAGIRYIYFTLDSEEDELSYVKIDTRDINFDTKSRQHGKNIYICGLI